MSATSNHLALYQSLFRGREDIYARRWVKGKKSGYMPAYDMDWKEYEKYKAQGGTLKTFKHKKNAPLTDSVIRQHLSGKQTIGIYPLLKDNTSWFIAADFDGAQWMAESLKFFGACNNYKIPAYLERSRSGNGGHVWIFFHEPLPARKSRKLAFHLLRESGILSEFEKAASFDRLFPNQNKHSGSEFGNLIALPLNGQSVRDGNTCFLDPGTGDPFTDQWNTLKEIRKVEPSGLDKLLKSIRTELKQPVQVNSPLSSDLEITLDRQIWLHRDHLGPGMISFLREKLNFANSDYLIKKNLGRSTFKTERYFNLIEEEDNRVIVPRGFFSDLLDYCREKNISWQITDQRRKLAAVTFQPDIKLYPYQTEALEKTRQHDFGVIVAPPGSGKTVMGLELIARKQQPALILVHRRQLFDQWMDRISVLSRDTEKRYRTIFRFREKHRQTTDHSRYDPDIEQNRRRSNVSRWIWHCHRG